MARVRGNSRSALNLRIKKNKEKKDAIKHGSKKLISTSRQGNKTYKYWDSNKRKYVTEKNLTKENKSLKSKTPTQTLSNEEIQKRQDKANFDRRSGKFSSRTDKGYQVKKEEPPKEESKVKSNELKDKTVNEKINKDNKDKKVEVKKPEKKADPLAKYRRGEGTGRKETRITKKLKKSGFTSDRLAKLREKNAAFQKAKKGGKEAMKKYREKYPKRG